MGLQKEGKNGNKYGVSEWYQIKMSLWLFLFFFTNTVFFIFFASIIKLFLFDVFRLLQQAFEP